MMSIKEIEKFEAAGWHWYENRMHSPEIIFTDVIPNDSRLGGEWARIDRPENAQSLQPMPKRATITIEMDVVGTKVQALQFLNDVTEKISEKIDEHVEESCIKYSVDSVFEIKGNVKVLV